MILQRDFDIKMNLKKIRRIKKKYNLETLIRRKNKFAVIFKGGDDHQTVPNLVQRNFDVAKADTVYSTDITYLFYGKGLRAYLSAVKDLATKEIVHYWVSKSLDLDVAMNGIEEFYIKLPLAKRRKLIVHSDQGAHYTGKTYRELMLELEIKQSMSRKANCLDNAPIESFFGHMKDELDLIDCKKFEDLKLEIRRFISYYNTERPQWALKGRTPAECRG